MIKIIRAKLHGIKVTGAELDYHGSVTLDPLHCKEAGIYPLEFVYIWNKNSGARISTYVIYGEAGSGCCVLNGAAARTCQTGDEVIISAVEYVTHKRDIYSIKPVVLTFDEHNTVKEKFTYDVYETTDEEFNFRIES